MSGDFDIILGPGSSSQFEKYSSVSEFAGFNLLRSEFLGAFETNSIAAIKYFASVPMFAYFKCFSIGVWLSLMSSIIIFAIISSIFGKRSKFKSIGGYIWNYSIVLISKSMNEFVVNSVPKLLIILWLMSALFISIQFTAYFLDFMIRTIPEIIVWTIEDLAERPDMRIVCRDDYALVAFAESEESVLANNIEEQLDTYYDYREENIPQKLIAGLNNGSFAYVHDRLLMLFTLIKLVLYENASFDRVHVSTASASYEPYFPFIKGESPPWILTMLNRM